MDTKKNLEIIHWKDYASSSSFNVVIHSHDNYEIYLFISGKVTYYIEENKYELKPGDILIIPPYLMHRPVFSEEKIVYERYVLSLDPSFIQLLSDESTQLMSCFSAINDSRNHLFHCNKEYTDEFVSLFEKLIVATQAARQVKLFGTQLMINSLMTETLILLNRLYFSLSPTVEHPQYGELISNVISYINNNLCEHLTLEKLCDEFFISSGHLIREFKKYTNTTVYDYVITKRLSYAKMLIRDGHSLTYSCHASGFNDYSNYYKSFKSKLGISPSEYKESISKNYGS